MERKKHIILIALLVSFLPILAQTSYQEKIYNAYISGDMDSWKTILQEMDRNGAQSSAFILEMVNYQYGYAGWSLGTGKKKEAQQWIEKIEQNLTLLEKKNINFSETEAYRGSLIGFKIGLNKLQAPFIGPKSITHAKNAMQHDAENPFGYMLYGNILFYTPNLFGGAKDEAMAYYLLALDKMESKKEYIHQNWNYLNLLTIIANAYYKKGNRQKATEYLQKALTQEPNFQWVKKELVPKYTSTN